MRYVARPPDEPTRPDPLQLVTDLVRHLALDDVEELVLARVVVQWRLSAFPALDLDEAERSARVLAENLPVEEVAHVALRVALERADDEIVGLRRSGHRDLLY